MYQQRLAQQLAGDKVAFCCVGNAVVKLIDITANNQSKHLIVIEEDQNSSIEVGTGTDPLFRLMASWFSFVDSRD